MEGIPFYLGYKRGTPILGNAPMICIHLGLELAVRKLKAGAAEAAPRLAELRVYLSTEGLGFRFQGSVFRV